MDGETPEITTAGMVVIGNEILTGKVADQNSPFLCKALNALGVDLRRIITVPDDPDLIANEVRDCAEQFTYGFTTGGIGPTHDDVTIPAIAQAFGVPVMMHPFLEKSIRTHYKERLTDDHLLMARVPQGAELLDMDGLYFPQIRFRNVYIFPGVPQLFQHKFNAIKAAFQGKPVLVRELFLKADEGTIAALLRETEQRFPGILIGSYPNFSKANFSVKITVESRDGSLVEAALASLTMGLQALPVTIVESP